MVSVPFAVVVSSSLAVSIACIIALAVSLANDDWKRNGRGSRDLLSQDASVSTPSSSILPVSSSSSPSKFSAFASPTASTIVVPSNESYFSAATSLTYIFMGYQLLNSSITPSSASILNFVARLNSSRANGTFFMNVINVSRSISSKIQLVMTANNSNSSVSSKSPVEILKRSIALDNSPVLVLMQSVGDQNSCIWAVVIGYDDTSGFLVLDPTQTEISASGDNVLRDAQWIAQDQFLFSRWKCVSSGFNQFLVVFRKLN